MNNRSLWIVALSLALIALLAWYYWPKLSVSNQIVPKPFSAASSSKTSPSTLKTSVPPPNAPVNAEIIHQAEVKREQSIINLWILTPIIFYGKVVDETGSPVEGAKVVLNAADQLYGVGDNYERTSDDGGLFSIRGIHGIGLTVTVSKQGYYSLPQSWGNFGYVFRGGNEKSPHTDPNDPAVFVLRKEGKTENLIVVEKDIKIPRDGTPIQLNLTSGQTYNVANGDIVFQSWTHDREAPINSHYDWNCIIKVPGGGLQARTGDGFSFTAPENGYQSSDEIKMSALNPKWDSTETREYFLKLASGDYARINLTMYAGGDNFLHISSYLNPIIGHANLEYNPEQKLAK